MNRILIITYYWPPAGGPGVQRWLNFVRFLSEFKKEVVVYIPENPDYPFTDESFVSEIPKNVTLVSRPIMEPYAWAKLFSKTKSNQISKGMISTKNQSPVERMLLWIRGNLFIPDARMFWIRPSVRFLKKYIEQHQIKTIISTGPPHSLHLIGLGLKQWRSDLSWVADFRDPWTTIGYHSDLKLTQRSKKKHKQLEHTVLNQADKIITTSFTTKEEFSKKTAKPIAVITNGYLNLNTQERSLSPKFTLSHIGSLLSGRNPLVLWKVLAGLRSENPEFSSDLELVLAGTVSEEVILSLHKAGLQDILNLLGYVSHKEAVALQRSAQLLLLIEIDAEKTKGIIPGKFFEYMAARRPILAIGPKNWDVARILNETTTGSFFQYDEETKLKRYILDCYLRYKQGRLNSSPEGVQAYHRKELTKKLVEFIS